MYIIPDNFVLLTEIAKTHRNKNKSIGEFMDQQRIKMWMKGHGGKEAHIFSKCGKYGGTWVSEALLTMYVDWKNKELFLFNPRFEIEFGKVLSDTLLGIFTIYSQYLVGSYRVDWYIPKLNLCIEYDEAHHRKKIQIKKEDRDRQKHIEKKLGCTFLRVEQGKEYLALGKIMRKALKEYL